MESMWEKLGSRATAFRKLSETEKNEVLGSTFRDVYRDLPFEEKQPIAKMVRGMLVKTGTQQSGVIRGMGEKSVIELIGHIGILLAGMSDEAIDRVIYERRKRRTMAEAE